MKTTDFQTEENRHPVLGEDNLPDPWRHSGIQLLQTACNPLLAVDGEFWKLNARSDALGHFPTLSPKLPAREPATRNITVFDDDLAGDSLELIWELREGSPSNWVFDQGRVPLRIRPGFNQTVPITCRRPKFNTFVFLTLRVVKDGRTRFENTLSSYEIVNGVDFQSEFNGQEREFK